MPLPIKPVNTLRFLIVQIRSHSTNYLASAQAGNKTRIWAIKSPPLLFLPFNPWHFIQLLNVSQKKPSSIGVSCSTCIDRRVSSPHNWDLSILSITALVNVTTVFTVGDRNYGTEFTQLTENLHQRLTLIWGNKLGSLRSVYWVLYVVSQIHCFL